MPSLIEGFAYDVFISYRQNDNRSGWVTQFVDDLKKELASTIKESVSIYFDENPHDGLQDTHQVDKSLEGKLKSLIFIPILSRTYCDPKSFAWSSEFLAFCRLSKADSSGLDVPLLNGNTASRVLPVQIHDLDPADHELYQRETGTVVRSLEFIFRTSGVSRPLARDDSRSDNLSRTLYRDQVNKTANAIREILSALEPRSNRPAATTTTEPATDYEPRPQGVAWFWAELLRRNVFRAVLTYIIAALLILQALAVLSSKFHMEDWVLLAITKVLIAGFPVAAMLAWLFEISPQGVIRTTSPYSYTNPYPPYRKKPLTSPGTFAVLIVSLSLLVIYIILILKPMEEKPQITIGVIPFENRSVNPQDKYIAITLTDDIISRLIVVSRFRVTADSKPIASENLVTAGIMEVANRLEVSYVLTGSVQRSGQQYIVRCRLFDALSSSFVWGNTFMLSGGQLVTVQSEIVFNIAGELKVDLNDLEELRLETPATENATAYDFYMKGKSQYLKYNRESNDSAVSMFRLALQTDSTYARAWAGLGDAYSQKYRFGYDPAWNDSGIVASQKAIRLDSNLSEAYKSLSSAYAGKRLYDKQLPLLKKSIELNPRNESAVGNLGTYYFVQGNLPEAIRYLKESARINSKKFIPFYIIGWTYGRLGEYEKSEEWLNESLALDSNFAQSYELLAYTYVAQQKKREALDLIQKLTSLKSQTYKSLEKAAVIAHYCGQLDRARELYQMSIEKNANFNVDPNAVSGIGLGQLLMADANPVKAELLLSNVVELNMKEVNRGSQDDDPPYHLAAVYAIQGKNKESLEWLQKAIDRHWLDYDQIALCPWFESLHNERRYKGILKKLRSHLDGMRKVAN